jgi:hypothetical protein
VSPIAACSVLRRRGRSHARASGTPASAPTIGSLMACLFGLSDSFRTTKAGSPNKHWASGVGEATGSTEERKNLVRVGFLRNYDMCHCKVSESFFLLFLLYIGHRSSLIPDSTATTGDSSSPAATAARISRPPTFLGELRARIGPRHRPALESAAASANHHAMATELLLVVDLQPGRAR